MKQTKKTANKNKVFLLLQPISETVMIRRAIFADRKKENKR